MKRLLATGFLLLLCAPASAAVQVVDRADVITRVELEPGLVLLAVEGDHESAPGELRTVPLTPAGRLRGPVRVIGTRPAAMDLIADPRGGHLAAVEERDADAGVRVLRIGADGGTLGEPRRFGALRRPALAATGTRGDALLAAVGPSGVIVARVPSEAGTAEAPVELGPGTDPAIAVDAASGRAFVAWVVDGGDGPDELFGVSLDPQGRPEGPPVQLTTSQRASRGDDLDEKFPGGAGPPALSRIPGGWAVAWHALEGTSTVGRGDVATYHGTYRLRVRRLTEAGQPTGIVTVGHETVADLAQRGLETTMTPARNGEVVAAATAGKLWATRVDLASGAVIMNLPLAQKALVGDIALGPSTPRLLTAFTVPSDDEVDLRTRLTGSEPPDVAAPRVEAPSVRIRPRVTTHLHWRCSERCFVTGVIANRYLRVLRVKPLRGGRGVLLTIRWSNVAKGCVQLSGMVYDRELNERLHRQKACFRRR